MRRLLPGLALLVLLGVALAVWREPALIQLQSGQRVAVERLGGEFTVLHFGARRQRSEEVLQLEVTTRRHVVVGERVLAPDPRGRAQASTLRLQGLQGPLLTLLVALLWPLAPARPGVVELPLRLLLAVPLAVGLALVDAPVVLLASIWDLIHDHLAPGRSNMLTLTRDLLRGGGRLALGVLMGLACVMLAASLSRRPQPRSRHGAPLAQ